MPQVNYHEEVGKSRMKDKVKSSLQIPESTISRLSLYLRQLDQLENEKTGTVRSSELAEWTGLTAAQVRKDLAYFGQFGVRGQGYPVTQLKQIISKTLGINRVWKTVIIGAGNLGRALSSYRGFLKEGFQIVALFDSDPKKIGRKKGGLPILPLTQFKTFAKKEDVAIAVLAIPAAAAQKVLDLISQSGIHSVLNFAPVELSHPSHIHVRNVDLATELITLAYYSKD